MTKRDPLPTGEIVLVDYVYETSSTHYDESRKVTLSANTDGALILEEFQDECDQFKGPRTERTDRWKIDRDALITLVKTKGERIS